MYHDMLIGFGIGMGLRIIFATIATMRGKWGWTPWLIIIVELLIAIATGLTCSIFKISWPIVVIIPFSLCCLIALIVLCFKKKKPQLKFKKGKMGFVPC